MSFDNHKNFAYSTIATPPSPAASGTSLTVAPGDGAKFPAAPFNVVVWPQYAYSTAANAEVARCTGITGDVLTIQRAQEGSAARTILAGDQIAATMTAKTFTDIEALVVPATPAFTIAPSPQGTNLLKMVQVGVNIGSAYTPFYVYVSTDSHGVGAQWLDFGLNNMTITRLGNGYGTNGNGVSPGGRGAMIGAEWDLISAIAAPPLAGVWMMTDASGWCDLAITGAGKPSFYACVFLPRLGSVTVSRQIVSGDYSA